MKRILLHAVIISIMASVMAGLTPIMAAAGSSASTGASTDSSKSQSEPTGGDPSMDAPEKSKEQMQKERIHSLTEQADDQAVGEILQIMDSNPDRSVTIQALIAMGNLEGRADAYDRLIQEARGSNEPVVQYAALASLWKHRTEENQSRLLEITEEASLSAGDPSVKSLANSLVKSVTDETEASRGASESEGQQDAQDDQNAP